MSLETQVALLSAHAFDRIARDNTLEMTMCADESRAGEVLYVAARFDSPILAIRVQRAPRNMRAFIDSVVTHLGSTCGPKTMIGH